MEDKHLYILLTTINNNSDLKKLTRHGFDFYEIAALIKKAVEASYLTYSKKKVFVTAEGLSKIEALAKYHKRTDKSKWIDLETKSKIPKIDKNFIYLPNQNELLLK